MPTKPLRRTRLLLLLSAVLWAISGARTEAASATNQVIGVKYTEKLSRKVKFVHAGPILGHWAEFADKGTFSLAFKLPMDGVDPTLFTDDAVLFITVDAGTGPRNFILALANDPKFETGDSKAKLLYTETLNGKAVKVLTVSIKFNPGTFTLDVKIKGQYVNNQRSDGAPNAAGAPLLADVMLGQPTSGFEDTAFISVGFFDATTEESVVGTAVMEFAGAVASTPVTDDEIGTFNRSTVVIGGISSP